MVGGFFQQLNGVIGLLWIPKTVMILIILMVLVDCWMHTTEQE